MSKFSSMERKGARIWKEFYKEAPHCSKHHVSPEFLWIDGWCKPSWIAEIHESALLALLRACTKHEDLCRGSSLHDTILQRGLLAACSDDLICMYCRCGALSTACALFDSHKSRDVFTWTTLIEGFAQNGRGHDALDYFERMQHEGLSPNAVTFACVLKACGSLRAADKGEKIHNELAKQGLLGSNTKLGTALVGMYAKCGALEKAQKVLKEIPIQDAISWNALIAGYAEHGKGEQALNCFEQMQREGLSPNAVTYACALKACGSIGAADKGEKIHDEIAKQGILGNDVVLGTALVDMYAKCGALTKARQVFEELPTRDVVSWNALITGLIQQGNDEQALDCFEQMQQEGVLPKPVTFSCILKACGSIGAVDKGKRIHDEIAKQGLLGKNIVLGNALVDMYAKCGALAKARQVLEELPTRNAISWNAMITGYAEHGEGEQALNCFEQMQSEGLSPNAVTFTCLLKACGSIRAAGKGEKFHDEITKQGWLGHNIVLGTALVDMYAKCGALAKAREVLKELPVRNVISWNALIAGYAEHDEGEQALNCFKQMQQEGLSPTAVTFACILKACGSIGAAGQGGEIHEEIAKQGLLGNNVVLATALVDMYAKCGALAKARQVLEELPVQDVISWNTLIAGLIKEGELVQALKCFEQMQLEGFSPNAATFSCVLSACSRLGLIEDAQKLFAIMSTLYALEPDLEQYTCMVDVFGRAGHLDMAVGVIEKMQSSDSGVWSALLGACQKWGDVNVGRWAFKHALQVDKNDAALYVLMADIYVAGGGKEDAENIEAARI